jgi:hypothetical protein
MTTTYSLQEKNFTAKVGQSYTLADIFDVISTDDGVPSPSYDITTKDAYGSIAAYYNSSDNKFELGGIIFTTAPSQIVTASDGSETGYYYIDDFGSDLPAAYTSLGGVSITFNAPGRNCSPRLGDYVGLGWRCQGAT